MQNSYLNLHDLVIRYHYLTLNIINRSLSAIQTQVFAITGQEDKPLPQQGQKNILPQKISFCLCIPATRNISHKDIYQTSYIPIRYIHLIHEFFLAFVAELRFGSKISYNTIRTGVAGFKPATFCFEGSYSVQAELYAL